MPFARDFVALQHSHHVDRIASLCHRDRLRPVEEGQTVDTTWKRDSCSRRHAPIYEVYYSASNIFNWNVRDVNPFIATLKPQSNGPS